MSGLISGTGQPIIFLGCLPPPPLRGPRRSSGWRCIGIGWVSTLPLRVSRAMEEKRGGVPFLVPRLVWRVVPGPWSVGLVVSSSKGGGAAFLEF